MPEITPADLRGMSADKLVALLQSPEAQAILATVEQKAAAWINGLPSRTAVALDAVTHQPVVTPGWKTSEFWTVVVFVLLMLALMLAGVVHPQYAVFAQAAVAGLYQISRGLTKGGTGN